MHSNYLFLCFIVIFNAFVACPVFPCMEKKPDDSNLAPQGLDYVTQSTAFAHVNASNAPDERTTSQSPHVNTVQLWHLHLLFK